MKRILYLENGDILGGAELFSFDFFEERYQQKDEKKEQENIFYTLGIGNTTGKVWEKWQKKAPENKKYSVIPLFLPTLKPLSYTSCKNWILAAWKLRTYIKKNNITHVHANTVRTFLIAGLAAVFLPLRIQFSFFSHDFTAPKILTKIFTWRFHTIATCSKAVKKHVQYLGVPEKKICIIPNGIQPHSFSHITPFIAEKNTERPLHIGILGRIDTWKGQHIFVQAAKMFLEVYPTAQFYVFGEPTGHDPLTYTFYENIKKMVPQQYVEKNIIFAGFTPPEKALKNIDILVHAAIEKEPFGRVPIEGAAAGKGLIISNIGTPADIFTEKVNAIFFAPKDPVDLAKKIKMVWENRLLLERIGENAKKLVEEKFLLSSVTKQLQKILEG